MRVVKVINSTPQTGNRLFGFQSTPVVNNTIVQLKPPTNTFVPIRPKTNSLFGSPIYKVSFSSSQTTETFPILSSSLSKAPLVETPKISSTEFNELSETAKRQYLENRKRKRKQDLSNLASKSLAMSHDNCFAEFEFENKKPKLEPVTENNSDNDELNFTETGMNESNLSFRNFKILDHIGKKTHSCSNTTSFVNSPMIISSSLFKSKNIKRMDSEMSRVNGDSGFSESMDGENISINISMLLFLQLL